jgi:type I restriction enzyme S subunit
MYALDNYISHIDVKQDVKGGLIKNLHIEDIKKIKINLPALQEQKKIVKEIEKRFEVADEVERVITENLAKAEQLKQSILKKAFEGRLVPQDPTDQPASELLAQIKAEREK